MILVAICYCFLDCAMKKVTLIDVSKERRFYRFLFICLEYNLFAYYINGLAHRFIRDYFMYLLGALYIRWMVPQILFIFLQWTDYRAIVKYERAKAEMEYNIDENESIPLRPAPVRDSESEDPDYALQSQLDSQMIRDSEL